MTFEHHRCLFRHLRDRKRCFPVCQKLFRSPRNQSRHLLFQVCFRKLRLISKTKPQYVLATASSSKIVFPRVGSNRGPLSQELSALPTELLRLMKRQQCKELYISLSNYCHQFSSKFSFFLNFIFSKFSFFQNFHFFHNFRFFKNFIFSKFSFFSNFSNFHFFKRLTQHTIPT